MAYYGLAMDLQKFGLSVYLVQVLFGVIDIPAMLVATTTMIYVGRRATVASFLILAGLMVVSNMFVPEGKSIQLSCLLGGAWRAGGCRHEAGEGLPTHQLHWLTSSPDLPHRLGDAGDAQKSKKELQGLKQ